MDKRNHRTRAVTIDDVAKEAGVSIKTVSRVMNREASVREETRERVLAAARELKYRPNAAARSLASSRSYFIAIVYDNPSESYLLAMQAGALATCHEKNYSLLLQPCDFQSPDIIDQLATLINHGHPGLVLTPPVCDVPAVIEYLNKADVKYASFSPKDPDHPAPFAYVDDRGATYDLTRYLIDLGHRRIGFIKGHPAHGASERRFEGFCDAMRDNGLEVGARLVAQGFFSFESGLRCALELLRSPQQPTALFASNDEMAAGVLHAAHDLGLHVPRDLSVVGFDDTSLSRHVWPGLTTVRQPVEDMAKALVDAVIAQMRNEKLDQEDTRTLFPYEIVVRGSTGPPTR